MERAAGAGEKKPILNEWTRMVLEKGIGTLVPKIYEDFGEKLPDVVILPDTSARPLYYAFKPSFDRIAAEKGINRPRFYFFKTARPNEDLQGIEVATEADQSMPFQELLARIKAINPKMGSEVEEDIPRMEHERANMKARAEEVTAHEARRGREQPSIAVIDEFTTYNASTIRELRRAFQMPDMKAYAVFTKGTEKVTSGYVTGPQDEQDYDPEKGYLAKLSYTQTDSVGVTKDSVAGPYAVLIDAEDPRALAADKKQLRDEMTAVGERIAANLSLAAEK